ADGDALVEAVVAGGEGGANGLHHVVGDDQAGRQGRTGQGAGIAQGDEGRGGVARVTAAARVVVVQVADGYAVGEGGQVDARLGAVEPHPAGRPSGAGACAVRRDAGRRAVRAARRARQGVGQVQPDRVKGAAGQRHGAPLDHV